MKAEEHATRTLEVEGGWQVKLTSYRLGEVYYCTADNVSPGANIARAEGATREEAENKALERAQQLLGRTRRQSIGS
jgi:hypothetical protein